MAVDLGNPSKDRERFVDTIILIATPDWSNRPSNFENVVETQFESICKVDLMRPPLAVRNEVKGA